MAVQLSSSGTVVQAMNSQSSVISFRSQKLTTYREIKTKSKTKEDFS